MRGAFVVMQEQAVLALAEIARRNRQNQTNIGAVTSGAVNSIVELLLGATAAQRKEMQVQCAWACWCVARSQHRPYNVAR